MEEWTRDSKEEKILLESSELQVEQPLTSLICACTCVVGERFCFLTGIQSLPGFGAGAISFNHFQNLCILFQSSCTWQRGRAYYSGSRPCHIAETRRTIVHGQCKNPPCKNWQHSTATKTNLLWTVNTPHV